MYGTVNTPSAHHELDLQSHQYGRGNDRHPAESITALSTPIESDLIVSPVFTNLPCNSTQKDWTLLRNFGSRMTLYII